MAKTGSKVRTWERFDCDKLCAEHGRWSDERRAPLGCRRFDLPVVDGVIDPKAIHRGGWMGRSPIAIVDAPLGVKINPKQPTEDPADGCPGAWYRSRFVASVYPYMRRRDDNGGRVANLLLDRSDDDLLVMLVNYFEHEHERFEGWKSEVIFRD